MSHVIQRSAEDADDLYVWWSGATLGPGAQVVCGPDETAIFFDGEQVLARVGPGTTALTVAAHPPLAPYLERHLFSGQKQLSVCFITLRPWEGWEVEIAGTELNLPDAGACEISGRVTLTVQVASPEAFVANTVHTDELQAEEDEQLEDEGEEEDDDATIDDSVDEDEDDEEGAVDVFIEKSVLVALNLIVVEQTPNLAQLPAVVTRELPAAATSTLKDFGIEVIEVSQLELYNGEELLP